MHTLKIFQLVTIAGIAAIMTGCATGPVDPSFPLSASDARRAIRDMRHNPKPLDRPVLVIDGYLDFGIFPGHFGSFVKGISQNAKVVTVSLGSCTSFDECRERVIAAADQAFPDGDAVWTTQVDVVGASLGGLVARLAASPSADSHHPRRLNIARLFTISSPHIGSKLADEITPHDFTRDLVSSSQLFKTLAKSDADTRYQLFPYVLLDDPIVGDRHAAPPGKIPYWLPNQVAFLGPHNMAQFDPRIYADISRRLRGEPGYTHDPPTPAPGT
jgi:hypothetical protein